MYLRYGLAGCSRSKIPTRGCTTKWDRQGGALTRQAVDTTHPPLLFAENSGSLNPEGTVLQLARSCLGACIIEASPPTLEEDQELVSISRYHLLSSFMLLSTSMNRRRHAPACSLHLLSQAGLKGVLRFDVAEDAAALAAWSSTNLLNVELESGTV